jgi:biopolymer transport protein TolR
MAFDDLSNESGAISQINVTPLVDVMLVLLIIFMVSAPMLNQGVELTLPKETIAPVKGSSDSAEQLTVSINKKGQVYIGAENEVEIESVGKRLAAILEKRDDKSVFIKADKDVTYGVVMAVMARIRRAGIYKVGLITDPSLTPVEEANKKVSGVL